MRPGQENLKPVRSKDEARKRGKKGGIKSGESRRLKKSLRERLVILLETKTEDGQGDNADAMTVALIREAAKGNVPAYLAVRDTVGEKPTDKVDQTVNLSRHLSPAEATEELLRTHGMEE